MRISLLTVVFALVLASLPHEAGAQDRRGALGRLGGIRTTLDGVVDVGGEAVRRGHDGLGRLGPSRRRRRLLPLGRLELAVAAMLPLADVLALGVVLAGRRLAR